MGVAMKINTVAVYVQLGLGTGIQPLIGYNYGAGNKKRLSDIFKCAQPFKTGDFSDTIAFYPQLSLWTGRGHLF